MGPPQKKRGRRTRVAKHVTSGTFKEGDVIINRNRAFAIRFPIDRGILLVIGDVWTVCFYDPRRDCLDLSGITVGALQDHYRLADSDERRKILLAMAGKNFGTRRGADYFTRWEPKLATVIKPLVDQAVQQEAAAQTYGGFREGDVILDKVWSDLFASWQNRGVLVTNEQDMPTVVAISPQGRFEGFGVSASMLEHYRLTTAEERREILLAMATSSFVDPRFPKPNAFWLSKYKEVIQPAIEAAIREARQEAAGELKQYWKLAEKGAVPALELVETLDTYPPRSVRLLYLDMKDGRPPRWIFQGTFLLGEMPAAYNLVMYDRGFGWDVVRLDDGLVKPASFDEALAGLVVARRLAQTLPDIGQVMEFMIEKDWLVTLWQGAGLSKEAIVKRVDPKEM